MKRIKITAPEEMSQILAVFAALDSVRWSVNTNYNLINHCTDDLSADEKLLSHWLSYIGDRQTAFERVWEVGGYVISHIVRSFIRDGKTPLQTMEAHLKAPQRKSKLHLECPLLGPNERLARHDINQDPVIFASRYMPADAVAIYRTLLILDAVANRSFAKFMYLAVHGETDQQTAVRRLAIALHFLTYADISQVSEATALDRIRTLPDKTASQTANFKADPPKFLRAREKHFAPYDKKRLWCSIRDYTKSPEFNGYFVEALKAIDLTEALRWDMQAEALRQSLSVIELPGDVWNNNRIFREGLFSPHLGPTPKTWKMPRTVRAIYDSMLPGKAPFYPEQLDVTFDFVPRMCAKRNCHICMFGAGIDKLCHARADLYCPVALAACGYVHPCNPGSCKFLQARIKGICKNNVCTAHPD